MWKIIDAHAENEMEGEIKLTREHDHGDHAAPERLVLPVTLSGGCEWSDMPETMTDQEVYQILMDIADGIAQDMAIASGDFDGFCEPEEPELEPGYMMYVSAREPEPEPTQPARVIGRMEV